MTIRKLLLAVSALAMLGAPAMAGAPIFDARANFIGPTRFWHRSYFDPAWGVPYAQVVPRRAHTQTRYSYGVTGTSIEPIYNEYQRPAGPIDGEVFVPTPAWPSDTDQFGGYYVRTPRHGR